MLIKYPSSVVNKNLPAKPKFVESRQAKVDELELFKKFFTISVSGLQKSAQGEVLKTLLDSTTAISSLTKNTYTFENGNKLLSYEFAPKDGVHAGIFAAESGVLGVQAVNDIRSGNAIQVDKGIMAVTAYGDNIYSKNGTNSYVSKHFKQESNSSPNDFKYYHMKLPVFEDYKALEDVLVALRIQDEVL